MVAAVRHNMSRTPTWRSWSAMLKRCDYPGASNFSRYGGRGITVCERWRDFSNFLADMGPRPSTEHSIDRIDTHGHYEPGNCRWATRIEQGRNTTRNVLLSHGGRTQCISAWAAETGLPVSTLFSRFKSGWSAGRVLGAGP